jgi:hypothetical protein
MREDVKNYDLIDSNLFGNEAGEDEDIELLSSYYLEKPENEVFYSDKAKLRFVRSRKGVGKSSLLQFAWYKQSKKNDDDILINIKAAELVHLQPIESDNPLECINWWQQRICSRINKEIGKKVKLALNDDSMTLVEASELSGFKGRNIVGSLIDRLIVKTEKLEVGVTKKEIIENLQILKRHMESSNKQVWVFIDDIDATFLNTEREKLHTSTFFTACRYLVNDVTGLFIRASVRTDVWSILVSYDEAVDKCEQYMTDLKWSTRDTGEILANKILTYYKIKENSIIPSMKFPKDEYKIFDLVFKGNFPWGNRNLIPYRPIHILSAGRPRWASQLCKLAGKQAYKVSSPKITISNIRDILKDYGKNRLSDLYKEHLHQCSELKDIIETFSGKEVTYTTKQLLNKIQVDVIEHYGIPVIDGKQNQKGALSVAHFLYRIGFLALRDERSDTGLGFTYYEDRPDLLDTESNLDDGKPWEIHPSYRTILNLKSAKKHFS